MIDERDRGPRQDGVDIRRILWVAVLRSAHEQSERTERIAVEEDAERLRRRNMVRERTERRVQVKSMARGVVRRPRVALTSCHRWQVDGLGRGDRRRREMPSFRDAVQRNLALACLVIASPTQLAPVLLPPPYIHTYRLSRVVVWSYASLARTSEEASTAPAHSDVHRPDRVSLCGLVTPVFANSSVSRRDDPSHHLAGPFRPQT